MQSDTNINHFLDRIKTQIMDLSQVVHGIDQFEVKAYPFAQPKKTSISMHLDSHFDRSTVTHADSHADYGSGDEHGDTHGDTVDHEHDDSHIDR